MSTLSTVIERIVKEYIREVANEAGDRPAQPPTADYPNNSYMARDAIKGLDRANKRIDLLESKFAQLLGILTKKLTEVVEAPERPAEGQEVADGATPKEDPEKPVSEAESGTPAPQDTAPKDTVDYDDPALANWKNFPWKTVKGPFKIKTQVRSYIKAVDGWTYEIAEHKFDMAQGPVYKYAFRGTMYPTIAAAEARALTIERRRAEIDAERRRKEARTGGGQPAPIKVDGTRPWGTGPDGQPMMRKPNTDMGNRRVGGVVLDKLPDVLKIKITDNGLRVGDALDHWMVGRLIKGNATEDEIRMLAKGSYLTDAMRYSNSRKGNMASPRTLQMMRYIRELKGETVTMADLQRNLNVSPSTAYNTVNILKGLGLVTGRVDYNSKTQTAFGKAAWRTDFPE